MARGDEPASSRRREVSPALIAAGLAALERDERRCFRSLLLAIDEAEAAWLAGR